MKRVFLFLSLFATSLCLPTSDKAVINSPEAGHPEVAVINSLEAGHSEVGLAVPDTLEEQAGSQGVELEDIEDRGETEGKSSEGGVEDSLVPAEVEEEEGQEKLFPLQSEDSSNAKQFGVNEISALGNIGLLIGGLYLLSGFKGAAAKSDPLGVSRRFHSVEPPRFHPISHRSGEPQNRFHHREGEVLNKFNPNFNKKMSNRNGEEFHQFNPKAVDEFHQFNHKGMDSFHSSNSKRGDEFHKSSPKRGEEKLKSKPKRGEEIQKSNLKRGDELYTFSSKTMDKSKKFKPTGMDVPRKESSKPADPYSKSKPKNGLLPVKVDRNFVEVQSMPGLKTKSKNTEVHTKDKIAVKVPHKDEAMAKSSKPKKSDKNPRAPTAVPAADERQLLRPVRPNQPTPPSLNLVRPTLKLRRPILPALRNPFQPPRPNPPPPSGPLPANAAPPVFRPVTPSVARKPSPKPQSEAGAMAAVEASNTRDQENIFLEPPAFNSPFDEDPFAEFKNADFGDAESVRDLLNEQMGGFSFDKIRQRMD